MSDLFPLPLFPAGSLDSSVVTTVWVGVTVLSLINLRLGWTFSGLVVPGYLVPLILVRPWSAAAILVEGLLCYFLVRAVAELPSRLGWWSPFFGRDRFFAILLASVAVRVGMDAYALPQLAAWLEGHFGLALEVRDQLHSFGLVIVALIANQLWKPGLARGFAQLAATLAITWAAVRFVLMEATNFHIGGLEFLYEDVATSILASPKTYVILVTAAFVASRLNLRYGWEFNGILIPALLALQWHQPSKIATTFVEAFVVLGIARLLLRTPLFRRASIENARLTLLFFNVSFAYKLLLGWGLAVVEPGIKISDAYGLGYLLPSLIALKMHEKGIALRMTRTLVQASLGAVVLATAIGFAVTLVPRGELAAGESAGAGNEPLAVREVSVRDLLVEMQAELRGSASAGVRRRPTPRELEAFRSGVRELARGLAEGETASLAAARSRLAVAGYELEWVAGGRYLHLSERAPARGWGAYLIAPRSPSRLVVEVPAPLSEWATLWVGGVLFERLQGAALAVAGQVVAADREAGGALVDPATTFQVFHETMGVQEALQVRALRGAAPGTGAARLWVRRSLPASLDLGVLEEALGPVDVRWGEPPFDNLQREASWSGFAELALTRDHRRELLVLGAVDGRIEAVVREQRIEGYLREWILEGRDRIAGRGTDAFVPATLDELLFLDTEVLAPLFEVRRSEYAGGRLSEEGELRIGMAAAAAAHLDLSLILYRHAPTGEEYLVVTDVDGPRRRYWGTWVLRLGEAAPIVVEVPRPLYERDTFEVGVSHFARLRAEALLLAGASPTANRDGSADVVDARNLATPFNLAHQVVLREGGVRVVVQVRAMRQEVAEALEVGAVVATSDGETRLEQLDPVARRPVHLLQSDGVRVRFADGSAATAAYEIGLLAQARYLDHVPGSTLIALWLAPQLREAFRLDPEATSLDAGLAALGVEEVEGDVVRLVAGARFAAAGATDGAAIEELARGVERGDVVALRRLERRGWRLERWRDRDTGQSYLALWSAGDELAALANLTRGRAAPVVRLDAGQATVERLERLLAARTPLLVLGREVAP